MSLRNKYDFVGDYVPTRNDLYNPMDWRDVVELVAFGLMVACLIATVVFMFKANAKVGELLKEAHQPVVIIK